MDPKTVNGKEEGRRTSKWSESSITRSLRSSSEMASPSTNSSKHFVIAPLSPRTTAGSSGEGNQQSSRRAEWRGAYLGR